MLTTRRQPENDDDDYLQIVKDIILAHIDKESVFAFLFGSRALNKHRQKADIDIGIFTTDETTETNIHHIINAIEESIVPYKVDIIDFNKADKNFKKIALQHIVIWNQPKDLTIQKIINPLIVFNAP